MKNISFKNVELTDGYWRRKQRLNENVTLDSVYNRFYDTGRIEAFKCDWEEGMDKKPHIFWDSDVAKWIEAASYILQKKEDKVLENKIDYIVDLIEKKQWDDGYFNIYFTVAEPEGRFTDKNCHELYCAGHLMEAAVAYYEATGKDKFLKCMERYADCIEKAFITEKTAKFKTPGHEEIELALIKMYKCTGNEKYLNISRHFIDNRGVGDDVEYLIKERFNEKYAQNNKPVRELSEAEGHAVRACYLYSGMADVAFETEDKKLTDACKRLFDDIVNRKMYITGGLGSTHIGENFTVPYDLPNETSYAETCASIAMIFFAHRMMKLDNNAMYADIIERELYNGAIAGLSLDGKSFFYENPLEINLKNHNRSTSTDNQDRLPITQRLEVFDCSCCPPNINRLLASVGDYIYYMDDDTVFVNQFMASTAEYGNIKISQETDYPHSGKVSIKTQNTKKLCIRIPSWCNSFKVNADYTVENGYAVIVNPENVEIEFEIVPQLMESNSKVGNNAGKVAVQYGPFVYCIESVDNTDNLYELFIDRRLLVKAEYSDLFDADILKIKGYRKITSDKLYAPVSDNYEDYEITAIPYACYANRGESNMLVWIG